MALRALSTITHAAAIVCVALAVPASTAPANDNIACWTADPRAKLLLASCAAVSPAGLFHRQRFGNATDEWFAYLGYRVECLNAIRDEIGGKLLDRYHRHGESAYEPFADWCRQPDVTAAINAVRASSTEG